MTMQRQMLVTGETRFVGLIGDPVFHIRSPEFYNPRLARLAQMSCLSRFTCRPTCSRRRYRDFSK
jgi:shikimate 5-dehydrogenase